MIDLVVALQAATLGHPQLFPHLVRSLVFTGGIYDDKEKNPGVDNVIDNLVRAGVLEHWQTQKKEAASGRRYGLTQRYHDTRLRVLTGVAHRDQRTYQDFATSNATDHEQSSTGRATTIRRYARDFHDLERERARFRRNGIEI